MNWEPLADWFVSTKLHSLVVDNFWVFPMCETLHFLGLIVLFGALIVVDFRVMGLARFINMKAAMAYIPVALLGFAVNLITGICFMSAEPTAYLGNFAFGWKMALILLAGVNALWFWFGEHKKLLQLADGEDAPFSAKLIAFTSIVLWVLVIIGGRMIPYVDQ